MAEPLDNVRDISRIAYGFIASKVLFAALDQLLARAFAALAPEGRIVLHDFMVDDDGRGPATAALWLVNALLIDPDVARLSPSLLAERLRAQGFDQLEHAEVIPGITRTITAVKRPG
jgi:2-hydroxy-4-(methylsulfanyl)butanoate S-methyltransferase